MGLHPVQTMPGITVGAAFGPHGDCVRGRKRSRSNHSMCCWMPMICGAIDDTVEPMVTDGLALERNVPVVQPVPAPLPTGVVVKVGNSRLRNVLRIGVSATDKD